MRPGSRHPWGIEELDVVSLGPLGEHGLLCDEAVPSVRRALMEQILCALIPAAGLVVMVGDLSVTPRPTEQKEENEIDLNPVC